jgi:hypothetical protein
MAWTDNIDISRQVRDTVEILWVQTSDGGELTDEILVDVSAHTKQDGTNATGAIVEEYEVTLFGAADTGSWLLEVAAVAIDAGGVGPTIQGPNYHNPLIKTTDLTGTGDFTVTTLATDAGDRMRIKARVTLK